MRSPAVKALLRQQAQRARDYYARAAQRAAARRTRAGWWPPRSWAPSTARSRPHRAARLRRLLRGRPHPAAAARPDRRLDLDSHAARAGHRAARRAVDAIRSSTMTPDVVVVGAGFAGLTAAAALADAGGASSCSRRGPSSAAGRRRSPIARRGELVDNGQHVLFGCYPQTFAFLRRIGAERQRPAAGGAERSVSGSRRAPLGAAMSAAAAAAAPAGCGARVGRDAVARSAVGPADGAVAAGRAARARAHRSRGDGRRR